MRNVLSLHSPLNSVFWSQRQNRVIKNILVVVLGSLFIALAAQIQILLQPVPINFQDFAVLFIGMAYGWRLGGLTLVLYFIEGICGLPVFAKHLNVAEFFSPAGGYLLAFLPAAMLSGYLVEKGFGRNFFSSALAGLCGLIIIFVGGILMLANFVGFDKSLQLGLYPFIFTDFLKLMLVASVIPMFWKSPKNNV
jgi:biotin transport system substrate-specific component